ncbi:MAG: nickel pincer cofactor biosynthesis protein LarC [Methanomicrobiales archaeon]|nr:nickel pincer cofactor biosynthesis protein LarC [Methanomicrobiales archaeon]
MRILLIDPFHGVAGDMIVGSLLHLGADREKVLRAIQSVVGEPGIREVTRAGISALQVDTRAGRDLRTLSEVQNAIASAEASVSAKEMARRVFQRLHTAEEQVHGPHPHFHEVGADDAVAEVLAACVALETLNVEGVHILPIAVGKGIIETTHGKLPNPAPATAEILKNSFLEISMDNGMGELCSPTGAAILAEFNMLRVPPPYRFRVCAVGYGSGTREDPKSPNVLRTMLLEIEEHVSRDTVDILETNVDDVTGEILSYTLDRLIRAGAKDVSAVPLVMKKGRPGFLVRVICDPAYSVELAALMAEELGTLGIRCLPSIHRFVANRSMMTVTVEISGQIRKIDVKCSWKGKDLLSMKPEYEQCRGWAELLNLPLRDVIRRVEDAAWTQVPQQREQE